MSDGGGGSDSGLIRTLDFILNRCDETSIDVIAEAVMRRRRELTVFGGKARLPDPRTMARELSGKINMGASIEGLRKIVQDMAIRIIRREAPELSDEQAADLAGAWIPASGSGREGAVRGGLPPDILFAMVSQFVNFSRGKMKAGEEKKLRQEMNAWPERYWKSFPEVVRLLVKDLLDGEIGEDEFDGKLRTALSLEN